MAGGWALPPQGRSSLRDLEARGELRDAVRDLWDKDGVIVAVMQDHSDKYG